MFRSLLIVLVAATAAWSAPVPKSNARPDPFGNGYMGVYRDEEQQLRIERVVEGGPADKAGLQPGDVFYEVGTLQPKTFKEIQLAIGSLRPGTKVPVVVQRGDRKVPLVIVLGERPDNVPPPDPVPVVEP